MQGLAAKKVTQQAKSMRAEVETVICRECTIASKIKVTPKGVYLPISKLHSILAIANLLAHNNKSQICYCGQISLQSAAVNCSFSDNLTPLGVTFILLAMVQVYNVRHKDFHFKCSAHAKVQIQKVPKFSLLIH